MDSSDESLLRRFARHRDFAAFDQLHLRYRDRVLNFAWRYCGDYQRAEEATQDTFLKILRQARRFRFEGKVSSWIFRIAINQAQGAAAQAARKRRFFREGLPADDGDDPPTPESRPDRIAAVREIETTVRRCLEALPRRYRQALLLSVIEGLPQKRIAEIMRCGIGTIGSLISRGRRIFRERFPRLRAAIIRPYPPSGKRRTIAAIHDRTSHHRRPDRKAPPGRDLSRRKRPSRVPSRPLPGLPGGVGKRALRLRRLRAPPPPKGRREIP